MKLKFGDDTSIQYRDNVAMKNIVDLLLPKIKCPYCGGKAYTAFEIDLQKDLIGWNFECKPKCNNSIEMTEEYGFEIPTKIYTHLSGKFYPAE